MNKTLIITALAAATSGSLQAVIVYDFTSGVGPFTTFQSTSVSHDSANQRLELLNSDVSWQWTAQAPGGFNDGGINAELAGVAPTISFDLIIEAGAAANFLQVNFAANSTGGGWSQFADLRAGDMTPGTYNFSYPASALGWTAGDTAFELNFGTNYGDTGDSIIFIDNVTIDSTIPEPSTTLLGLLAIIGSAARRRR